MRSTAVLRFIPVIGAVALIVECGFRGAAHGENRYDPDPGMRVLFEQSILTQPDRKRVVFVVPVSRLADELRRAMSKPPFQVVEHVYDF